MSLISATIPRQFVRLGFFGARLPIAVAEHLTERVGFDISGFPPIELYDSVEAQAKKVLGRVLADGELVTEGLEQEKAVRGRQGFDERRAELEREEEEARRVAEEKAKKREAAERRAARIREKAEKAKERQAELERIQAEAEARREDDS